MLVRDWMSKTVIIINSQDSMQDAIQLLKEHGIKRLPVLDQGKLVGIVTDRDFKRASASDASSLEIHELIYLLSKIKIKDVMTLNPVTVPSDATIEETAQILLAHNISGVPVMGPDGSIAGIVSQTDLFRVLASLTGGAQKGIQIAVETSDKPGVISQALNIIRQNQGRIMSVLSSNEHAPEGYRRIYIRTYDVDQEQMKLIQDALIEMFAILYVVDHRDNTRTIY